MARRAVGLLLIVGGGEHQLVALRIEGQARISLAAAGQRVHAPLREIIQDHRVARERVLLLLGRDHGEPVARTRYFKRGDVLQRVRGPGRGLDHQQVLGFVPLHFLRGEQVRSGAVAEGRLAGFADHLPRETAQVHARHAVLGLLVGFLLVDLGLARVREGGLHGKQAGGGVLRPLQARSARHGKLRAGGQVLQVQGAVALLGTDLIAEQAPVGGELDRGDGLPAVVYVVVEGLLLGPQGAGSGKKYGCDQKQDK